jgi:hypothetical protein
VLRKLSLFTVAAWFLASAAPLRAQDAQAAQPSVADAARQARKDKDKDKNAAATKTVITDDNLAAGASAAAVSSKLGDATPAAPSASGKSSSFEQARAGLELTEASLDQLEPLGREELAQTVLKGNTADFPGRSEWEEKLYSAKGLYIARSRQLIEAMKQTFASMESLQAGGQGKVAPNDPRVQELSRKATQIMQIAARTENAFQAVVKEGQNLAAQAPPR